MPVQKGKFKKNNIDKEVKRQIKDSVEKLPKLIVDEMKSNKDNNTKQENSVHYNDPAYKKKKIYLWAFVIIFFSIILVMWIININSVFYDFNRILKNSDSSDILNKTGNAGVDSYKNDFDNMMAKLNKTLEDNFNEIPEETAKKEKIGLEDIVNAVNNFTSTTVYSTSSTAITATSTMSAVTSTEETSNN
ncbi:MAG: hypothetical protein Q8P20_05175 [bacterium]|nr:hypothetical protein [bacterium]